MAISELIHASIISVVHEVVDGVITSVATARIATDGATVKRITLSGGVVNKVAATVAAALEGVVEAQPVPHFVSHRLRCKAQRYSKG